MPNYILEYLIYGFYFLFLSLFIIYLANYISIIYSLILVISSSYIIPNILEFKLNKKELSYNFNIDYLQSFSDTLCNKHNIPIVDICISQINSGTIEYQYNNSHKIYVPMESNPDSKSEESKAVVAHELSHLINNDRIKYNLFRSFLICINSILLYFIYNNLNVYVLIVFSVFILVITPSILNILIHRFEYRADEFAVLNTSAYAVSLRLRRNQTIIKNSSIKNIYPFIMPHPPISKRLKRINNINNSKYQ